jgi:hypothetical protein
MCAFVVLLVYLSFDVDFDELLLARVKPRHVLLVEGMFVDSGNCGVHLHEAEHAALADICVRVVNGFGQMLSGSGQGLSHTLHRLIFNRCCLDALREGL